MNATDSSSSKQKVSEAVAFGVSIKASDWHWQSGQPLALTVAKEILKCDGLDKRPLILVEDEDIPYLLNAYSPETLRTRFRANPEDALDPSARVDGHMFRLHFEMESSRSGGSSIALTMRHIPADIPVMESLGLPVGFINMVKSPPATGLVVVSGATGNGKTTTLASAINHFNHNLRKKIVTIEAPVEFFHTPDKCVIEHRTVGIDLHSFKDGIEQVLRGKPDIIVVGEMRDLDTISAALSAAETGHLVFGTLHTNNAPGVINRILDVVPEGVRPQYRTMLSHSLRAIICQRLIPKVGGGMVGAFEFMVNTPAIANQIRDNKVGQIRGQIALGKEQHMLLMNDSLSKLVKDNKITREVAIDYSDDRESLNHSLGQR